jgi:hypothetical protein
MQTPDGRECPHYYADFHRGHSTQLCRLLEHDRVSLPWKPTDCARCPVPDILHANASKYLRLELSIQPIMLGLGRRLTVQAFCDRHDVPIEDPFVGCPKCNAERPGLDAFFRALEETDDD